MVKEYKCLNKEGLHMRPSNVIALGCNDFSGNITMSYTGVVINPKSVIAIASLGVKFGDVVSFSVKDDIDTSDLELHLDFAFNTFLKEV